MDFLRAFWYLFLDAYIRIMNIVSTIVSYREEWNVIAEIALSAINILLVAIIAVVGFYRYKPQLWIEDKYKLAREFLSKFYKLHSQIEEIWGWSTIIDWEIMHKNYDGILSFLADKSKKMSSLIGELESMKVDVEFYLSIDFNDIFRYYKHSIDHYLGEIGQLVYHFQLLHKGEPHDMPKEYLDEHFDEVFHITENDRNKGYLEKGKKVIEKAFLPFLR